MYLKHLSIDCKIGIGAESQGLIHLKKKKKKQTRLALSQSKFLADNQGTKQTTPTTSKSQTEKAAVGNNNNIAISETAQRQGG